MRFKITLEINRKAQDIILPINYQYALSSFIYHTINKGNKDLASWLHQRGFALENKSFKLFTFSALQIPKYKQYDDRLIILSDNVEFILSFFPIELTESFVFGLFSDREFSLGDKKSSVNFAATNVERLPDPEFKPTMEFKTLSPVVLTTKTESKVIGYQYKFSITAHPELIKTGYYAGFGEKNSMGFGCVA